MRNFKLKVPRNLFSDYNKIDLSTIFAAYGTANGPYGGSGNIPEDTISTMLGNYAITNGGNSFTLNLGDVTNEFNGDGIRVGHNYVELGSVFGGSSYSISVGSDVNGVYLQAGGNTLEMNTENLTITDGRAGGDAIGLVYSADLSNSFVANSLVSKAYVDNKVKSGQGNNFSGTTDTDGLVTITHGLGYDPLVVVASVINAPYFAVLTSVSSTELVYEIRDITDGGAIVSEGSVVIHWISIKED